MIIMAETRGKNTTISTVPKGDLKESREGIKDKTLFSEDIHFYEVLEILPEGFCELRELSDEELDEISAKFSKQNVDKR